MRRCSIEMDSNLEIQSDKEKKYRPITFLQKKFYFSEKSQHVCKNI